MAEQAKKGCKKQGRHLRSASCQAYKIGSRSIVNKDKHIKREARRAAKAKAKWANRIRQGKPLRGAARNERRSALQAEYAVQHGIQS